jgi:hypothetical protein
MTRFVIVHYHLYKNAGSTIDSILDANFSGEERGHLEGPYPWSTVSASELLEFTLANPKLRAISSHQARLPLPEHPDVTFLPIFFLRHPIDRVGSVYSFERQQPADSISPSTKIARTEGLASFTEWLVGREGTGVCRNFQVIHLSTDVRDVPEGRATLDDYRHAVQNLTKLPFFGLVEAFDESLDRMQRYLEPYFGKLDMCHTPVNVTAGRKPTIHERIEAIRSELGPSLYRELLEHNALDLLLYEQAQQLFAAMNPTPVATEACLPPPTVNRWRVRHHIQALVRRLG